MTHLINKLTFEEEAASVVLSILVASIMAQLSTPPLTGEGNMHQNLSSSCNDFTQAFYKALSCTTVENIVSSPLSVHIVLSLLSHGAESETFDQLVNGISYPYKDLIQDAYKPLIAQLTELTTNKLYIANAICVQDGFELQTEFSAIAAEAYQSEILKVNFEHNMEAANRINTWIKTKTNDKISDLVSSDSINEDTKLVIVNAIYFNGNWLHKFDEQNTQNRVFHVTQDQQKRVPTMNIKSMFNHGKIPTLNATFIEIPYTNADVVLTIILPDEVVGLSNLQSNFTWKVLKDASRLNSEVDLYLPRFKIEFAVDLENILRAMGITKIFDMSANFKRISNVPLKVDKILHKAVIQVNEKGTEAAAATVCSMRFRRMIVEPERFVVNRPFMFIIEHKQSNTPLFIGSVKDIKVAHEKQEL